MSSNLIISKVSTPNEIQKQNLKTKISSKFKIKTRKKKKKRTLLLLLLSFPLLLLPRTWPHSKTESYFSTFFLVFFFRIRIFFFFFFKFLIFLGTNKISEPVISLFDLSQNQNTPFIFFSSLFLFLLWLRNPRNCLCC